jgi:tetratricopeptide (TPR) repeat protein
MSSAKYGGTDLLLGLLNLAGFYFPKGEPQHGRLAPGRRCLQLTQATADPELLATAHHLVGVLAMACGNLREAVSNLDPALAQFDRTEQHYFLGPFRAWSAAASVEAVAIQLQGRVREAAILFGHALRRARESGHLFSLAQALSVGQLLRCIRREPEGVLISATEVIRLAEENGFALWLHWGRFFRGWALAESGQFDEGLTEMVREIANIHRLGIPYRQFTAALVAQGLGRMERLEQAQTILEQALARLEETGEKVGHAEILGLKSEVLVTRKGVAAAEAEQCFRNPIEIAGEQEAKWWQLRSSVSLARLLRNTSRRDQARTMLADIYNWFTDGFDLPDLKEAKALLEELGGQ